MTAHGTNGNSNYGCRCELCVAAHAEYMAEYRLDNTRPTVHVDPAIHRRLKARAADEGVSLYALVNDMLLDALPRACTVTRRIDPATRRTARRRADAQGPVRSLPKKSLSSARMSRSK